MAIFYHQVVFRVSCSEAEWLSIMFVRGNFIEERWDPTGWWCMLGSVWGLGLGQWLYTTCRHLGLFVTNKPCSQSDCVEYLLLLIPQINCNKYIQVKRKMLYCCRSLNSIFLTRHLKHQLEHPAICFVPCLVESCGSCYTELFLQNLFQFNY